VYANPFDPEQFGHAIATVLQHREIAAQLAKHGAQKARARFTWTGIAHQLLRLMETPAPGGNYGEVATAGAPHSLSHQFAEDEDLPVEEAAWNI
jgi:hypothetical protein